MASGPGLPMPIPRSQHWTCSPVAHPRALNDHWTCPTVVAGDVPAPPMPIPRTQHGTCPPVANLRVRNDHWACPTVAAGDVPAPPTARPRTQHWTCPAGEFQEWACPAAIACCGHPALDMSRAQDQDSTQSTNAHGPAPKMGMSGARAWRVPPSTGYVPRPGPGLDTIHKCPRASSKNGHVPRKRVPRMGMSPGEQRGPNVAQRKVAAPEGTATFKLQTAWPQGADSVRDTGN